MRLSQASPLPRSIADMHPLPLPPDTEETLRERAKANGEDVSSYAARLIQEALNTPSVDELLAPFRKQVEESVSVEAGRRRGRQAQDVIGVLDVGTAKTVGLIVCVPGLDGGETFSPGQSSLPSIRR